MNMIGYEPESAQNALFVSISLKKTSNKGTDMHNKGRKTLKEERNN